MSRDIEKVSYMTDEGRNVVLPHPQSGKFLLTYFNISKFSSTNVSRYFSLYRFVTHEKVKDNDPVLTMKSGEKIRVYHGGDSSQMLAEAAGLIDKHDNKTGLKESLTKKIKEKKLTPPSIFDQDDQEYSDYPSYFLDNEYDDDIY
tara:strand:- start:13016 stop:13450 length:435 start_codon:yes stop_codon:yes gene_type:complete